MLGLSIGSVESFFGAVLKVWSVLFIPGANLSLNSFFFPPTGPREKNQVGEEESTRSGFFSPGESEKQEAEVYFSWERH